LPRSGGIAAPGNGLGRRVIGFIDRGPTGTYESTWVVQTTARDACGSAKGSDRILPVPGDGRTTLAESILSDTSAQLCQSGT